MRLLYDENYTPDPQYPAKPLADFEVAPDPLTVEQVRDVLIAYNRWLLNDPTYPVGVEAHLDDMVRFTMEQMK